jgi:hypothetical protein
MTRRLMFAIASVPAVAAAVILMVAAGASPPTGALPPPTSSAVPATMPTSSPGPAFAGLPVDVATEVTFVVDRSEWDQLEDRERKDQLRDWLMNTVIADAALSAETTSRLLLPPVRHGHDRSLAYLEYGTSRMSFIGEGRVVALVPQTDPMPRGDHLARMADEYRKATGLRPEVVHVFEYEIGPTTFKAGLVRRADIAGGELFTEQTGYHEQRVRSVESFGRFLEKTSTVVYARREADGLVLGGRRFQAPYRGLTVEDVAAVWQAQKNLTNRRRALDRQFEAERLVLHQKWQAKLDASTAATFPRRFQPPDEAVADDRERHRKLFGALAEHQRTLGGRSSSASPSFALPVTGLRRAQLQTGYEAEHATLVAAQERQWFEARIPDHTGFSLDTVYDHSAVKRWYREQGVATLTAVSQWEDPPIESSDVEAISEGLTSDEPRVLPVLLAVRKIEKWIGVQNRGPANLSVWLALNARHEIRRALEGGRYQQARYDGPLEGTEVGMTLFYTDLLAKLWSGVARGRPEVEGFVSAPQGGLSPVYEKEALETPNTRLWFGLDERGYGVEHGRSALYFGPRTARIYSASRDELESGSEVATTYMVERGLEWWDDHYDEMAAYEPQYQRLNEYMKWTAIVVWIHEVQASDDLVALDDVPVRHNAWFPTWALGRSDLRYRNWSDIEFFAKGDPRASHEALPLLKSRPFATFGDRELQISGGVSGARPVVLRERFTLPQGKSERLASGLNGVRLDTVARERWRLLNGTEYKMEGVASGRATVVAVPEKGRTLRSAAMDVRPTQVARTVVQDPPAAIGSERALVAVESRVGNNAASRLEISRTSSGFVVGVRGRDLDAGYAFARELSRARDRSEELLEQDPRVRWALLGDGDGTYWVLLHGATRWLKVAPEGDASVTLKTGWDARVADTSPGAERLNLAWVDAPDLSGGLRTGKPVEVQLGARPGAPTVVRLGARPPPPGAARFNLRSNGDVLTGLADDAGRRLWMMPDQFPESIRGAPERLTTLLEMLTAEGVRKAAAPGGLDVPATAAAEVPGKVLAHLARAETREAAQAAAADPQATREALDGDLAHRRHAVANHAAAGRPTEAWHLLEETIRIHGEKPELRMQRGLLLLTLGLQGRIPQLLNDCMGRVEDRASVRQEIHRRLAEPGQPLAARQFLDLYGRLSDVRGTVATRGLLVTTRDGKLELSAVLPGPPTSRPAQPAELKPDSILYLDDAPSIANRDWSPAARQRTLAQAIAADEVELRAVHAGGTALVTVPDWVRFTTPDRGVRMRRLENAVEADADGSPSPRGRCGTDPSSAIRCAGEYVYVVVSKVA